MTPITTNAKDVEGPHIPPIKSLLIFIGSILLVLTVLTAIDYTFPREPITPKEVITRDCGAIIFRNVLMAGETEPLPACIIQKGSSVHLYHPENPNTQVRFIGGDGGQHLLEAQGMKPPEPLN